MMMDNYDDNYDDDDDNDDDDDDKIGTMILNLIFPIYAHVITTYIYILIWNEGYSIDFMLLPLFLTRTQFYNQLTDRQHHIYICIYIYI